MLSFRYDENIISPCVEAFKQMTKLKMLIVEYTHNYDRMNAKNFKNNIGIMDYLPRSLMVLELLSYPGLKLFFSKVFDTFPISQFVLKVFLFLLSLRVHQPFFFLNLLS